ncbi:FAD-dependent monooxygenase [Saccharopolyspora indica]|uniref:FAD-dependent monooxygenase n=1 Tax=Saccharopolyspora indica TaxID=1229659 RepID=UPI0022EB9C60|nr:FAD-dependent monooxygenase [Saccharopolyspora indica]MDA3643376.1 FAD-dependent monooxygenase [Saccharopolyspora indica]
MQPSHKKPHNARTTPNATTTEKSRRGGTAKSRRGGTVLISGASIAGPALAFWLREHGFHPTVVERAPEIRDGGYAIDVRGAAITVAERMGVLPQIREACTGMRGITVLGPRSRPLADVRTGELMNSPGDVEIMRGTLGRILHERTDGVEHLFSDSIAAIEQDADAVRVTFERAEPREFDLVIGADGLHSNVRDLVFGPESGFTRYLGYHISIFSTENFLDLDRWAVLHNTPGRLAGLYRSKADRGAKAILAFASPRLRFDHRDPGTQLALLDKAFRNERWIVPQLLEAARSAPDLYFDSITQIRMDSWTRGRVALVGDAGYGPSPLSGQGSSLALVGAYVLARELHAANGDHRAAFRGYEHRMRNFVTQNQQFVNDGGRMLIPKTSTGLWLRNQMFRLMHHLPTTAGLSKNLERAANAIDLPGPAA